MSEQPDNVLIDTDFGLMSLNIFNSNPNDTDEWWFVELRHSEHDPVYLSATMSKDMWLKLARAIESYFVGLGDQT